MDVLIRKAAPASRPVGALAIGVAEGAKRLTGAALAVDRATRGAVGALLAAGDFRGRANETAVLYPKGLRAKRLIAVGLGRAQDVTEQRLLLAAAQCARKARDLGAGSLALALHEQPGVEPADGARAVAEGAVLGHYRHTAYRTGGGPAPLSRAELLEPSASLAASLAPAVARGLRVGEAVCLARDLANTPGQDLTPERLAKRAAEIAKSVGAKATIHDPAAIERLGMGCLLAVGRGSPNGPRFIALEWSPPENRGRKAPSKRAGRRAAKRPTVVVIGKGVTFDTGGISLKRGEGMAKMKYDMSGAAAVLGLFSAIPALALDCRLVGLIPSAENMADGRAVKPGDVVRALDGTTIEVTNTDAEGRLLLADALGYAKRYEPETVVDLATLTGAISIALGRAAAGLYTADDALAVELESAGEATGERLWRMPLWEEFLADMRSDTADLVNSNEKREGAANTAAAFLGHFARGLRWAHLDIASTAWTYSERPHESRGANGFGVRLLVEWLTRPGGR